MFWSCPLLLVLGWLVARDPWLVLLSWYIWSPLTTSSQALGVLFDLYIFLIQSLLTFSVVSMLRLWPASLHRRLEWSSGLKVHSLWEVYC